MIVVAVISDVHGNVWALEAVLKDIQKRGIKTVFNLGDALYGPLEPQRTAEMIRQEDIISISGNQDRNILESRNKASVHPTMDYVIENIEESSFQWLEKLPMTKSCLDTFFLFHGTPEDDHTYLLETVSTGYGRIRPSQEIQKEIESVSEPILLCGHSHTPRTIRLSSGKTIVNPGSVGLQAYDDELPFPHIMETGSPYARYTILYVEEKNIQVEEILLSYPFEKAAASARKRQREDWAKALLWGRM